MSREIPPLPRDTILLVEVGSTAHGTGLPNGEDHDEMGVVVETAAQVLGLDDYGFRTVMQRTQPDGVRSGPGDTDRTLYSLRRFVRLAAGGNPSILMSFWAPVIHTTKVGDELRALADAFVGRHVVPRYRGYMQSQARRVLGTDYSSNTKPAMHCARLGYQCIELLTTRELKLPIQGEPAEWVRAVRRGDVDFDDWWARVLELDAQLEQLEADERFPEGPDRPRIEAWMIGAHLACWA